MLEKLPPWATRFLSGLVFLFVVGVVSYALTEPYMKNHIYEINFDKKCDKNNNCSELYDEWKSYGPVLKALYITLISLAGICFILYITNLKPIFNIISFLLLAVAIATLITLIVIVKTSYVENKFLLTNEILSETHMKFTSASILVIIACCFMIVKPLFANDYIRNLLLKLIPHRKHK